MPLINSEIKAISATAFHNGAFVDVSRPDIRMGATSCDRDRQRAGAGPDVGDARCTLDARTRRVD